MRRLLPLLLVSALAACSQQNAETAEESATETIATEAADSTAPGVSVTAAPGVAFSFNYAFRLPSGAIARTQETHAQACERLGIARCRVTGMRYQLRGEKDIVASLALKLDPTIARQFGKQGIDAVVAAEGALVDAAISGTDAGAEIGRLASDRATAADELRRLDRELARSGLSTGERAMLQGQRAEAAGRIAAAQSGTADRQASLASTPMLFDYSSGPAVRGFDMSAPFASAVDTAASSAELTLAFLLGALAVLGPPLLALALLWFGWRHLGRGWRNRLVTPA